MKKIIGIVSLYNPNLKEVIRNIQTYLLQLDKLIIWDNTAGETSNSDKIKEVLKSDKISIFASGNNEGLGKPFNEAIQIAQKEGFDFLMTMDQDSYFEAGDFEKYLKLVESNDELAIYSPDNKGLEKKSEKFVEVRSSISSGSIYPMEIFERIGNFRDDYFVYMLDIEFCFRAKRNNIKTLCATSINLQHKEGYAEKSKLGLKINHYPAQSTYYIIRNTILTWKLYPEFTTNEDRHYFYKYKLLYRLLKIGFEKQSLLKIKALCLGIWHGMKFKTGSYTLI